MGPVPFGKYDRSVLALELEPLYAAEAKRRQQEHGSTTSGKPKSVSQKSDEVITARTDEQLAKLAGTSRDTIRKARQTHFENELHISYTQGHKKVTHRCFYNTLKHKQVNQIYGLTC